MKVGVAKETAPGERRVALVPEVLGKLKAAGLDILVERGAGSGSSIPDAAYEEAGATVVSTDDLYRDADAVLRVAKPSAAEVGRLRQGQAVLGLLSPLIDPATAKALADRGVTAISLDAIPRTLSRAQTMDALSSQANVGGYKAVLIAANAYGRYFPLLTTAAGTAKPANVLILGIGVAGLQAIGTARRLGAVVKAYDVRPETREQAESLGAQFVKLKTTIDATTFVPCTWLMSKHSIRSGATESASESCNSPRARDRAVRSDARLSLCCCSDCLALRSTVSASARLSPRCGTRSDTREPRRSASHSLSAPASSGTTGTSTSRGMSDPSSSNSP